MRTRYKSLVLMFVLLLHPSILSAQGVEQQKIKKINQIIADQSKVKTEVELIKASDLIVHGDPTAEHPKSYPVRGDLVNFVQNVQVKVVLKGDAPKIIQLLRPGMKRLPDADSPLNDKYPGPLVKKPEGYILFLKRTENPSLYSVVGIWQGVYPVYDGKVVALDNFGFSSFKGLSLQALQAKIREITR